MRLRQRRAARWTVQVLGLSMLAALAGCQQASSGGTVTPGGNGAVPDGPDPQGREDQDTFGDLKAQLNELGGHRSRMSDGSDGSFDVCEDLCALTSSICSVKVKLCDIADQHPGEEEYTDLCRKAELECSEAEDSCVECVEERRKRSEATPSSGG